MKKTTKKSVAIATLALAATIATPAIVQTVSHEVKASTTVQFKDIQNHWATSMINEAVKLGYVSGYVDGTFKPDNTVSNSEFIKMLTVALNPNAEYKEVNGAEWYQPYVNEAIKQGLISKNEFPKMTDNMKRSELAKLGARGIGETTSDNKKWMYLATSKGLILGVDNKGTLNENGTMSRAEAVTVINRVLKVKAGETLPTDKYAISHAEILWHHTNIFTVIPKWFNPKIIDRFKGTEDRLVSVSPDGNVVSRVKMLVAIDMDDPNDPYRYLLDGRVLTEFKDNKRHYYSTELPNGYIFVSVGELKVNDLKKLTINNVLVADMNVSISELNIDYTYGLTKVLESNRHESRSLSFISNPNQNYFEYNLGYWISKDYPFKQYNNIKIQFNGMLEYGNPNGSTLLNLLYGQENFVN